jgi:hypothetical protein
MRTRISHEAHDQYLRVTLQGQTPGPEARDLLLQIRRLADQHGKSRILVDALGVSAPMPDLERYVVGGLAAAILGASYRVAVIYARQYINKLLENVAVNRGARVRVVGS